MRRGNEVVVLWDGYSPRYRVAALLAVIAMLLTSCAVVNGSAYRVQPCPARSDTTAKADSLRRHIGCFGTTDSTRKER